jgi:ubiquinone biosynthesis protein Coq4
MSDNYLDRDCNITIRQAIDIFYAQNPNFYQPKQLDDDSRAVFFASDVCHIIFGCDTSLNGAFKIDTWVLNAIDLSLKEYYELYTSVVSVRVAMNQISPLQVFFQAILSVFSIVRVYFAGKRVKPKWRFFDYEDYLDLQIMDVRKEFNINVI